MLAFGLRGVAGRGLVFVIRALWNGYLRADGWQIWLRFEAGGFIASAGLFVMRVGDFAGRGAEGQHLAGGFSLPNAVATYPSGVNRLAGLL